MLVPKFLQALGLLTHLYSSRKFKPTINDPILFANTNFLLNSGVLSDIMSKEKVDYAIAVGPMPMMRAVADLTRDKGIKTEASMNPIMVDGTGMCGACRVTVGGEVKFACVDGPDFDAHQIDFDEVINRTKIYKDYEKKRSENCNLFKQAEALQK